MNKNLLALLVALFVDLLGIPMVAVASNSLYSKITHKETQGRHTPLSVALMLLYEIYGSCLRSCVMCGREM